MQSADSFVDGLSAACFHDLGIHPWAKDLEENFKAFLEELTNYEFKRRSIINQKLQLATLSPTGTGAQSDGAWLVPRDAS